MNRIYETKVRSKMIHAMHKTTSIGCNELVQQAINQSQSSTIKQYILRNYAKKTHQWALWACQHLPLLLQITSTNALESYHSELKRTTASYYGLIGIFIYFYISYIHLIIILTLIIYIRCIL